MIRGKPTVNNFKHVKNVLEEFKKHVVKIGLPKGTPGTYENGMSVIQVGIVHEFGSPSRNIPQRSFLRAPMYMSRDKIKKMIFNEYVKCQNKTSNVQTSLKKMGIYGEGISKKSFRVNDWAPLKPATIKAKGNKANPLINTGQLRNSITSIVEKA